MSALPRLILAVAAALTLSAVFGSAALAEREKSEPRWVPGELIVAFEEEVSRADGEEIVLGADGTIAPVAGLRALARSCAGEVAMPNAYRARFRNDRAASRALRRLGEDPGVAYVERNDLVSIAKGEPQPIPVEAPAASGASAPASTPFESDEFFNQQWGLHNTGQKLDTQLNMGEGRGPAEVIPDADIDAPEAWQRGADGEGQVIAVVDDGVWYEHPDLAANIWHNPGEAGPLASNGRDDDRNGWVDDHTGWDTALHDNDPRGGYHGTEVAGTAAAVGDNGVGIAGAAPRAKIMPIRFLSYAGLVFHNDGLADYAGELNAIEGMAYAIVNGADVINNSWGFNFPVSVGSPTLMSVIACAAAKDVAIAWAAGNEAFLPLFPPAYNPPNVINAGGMREDNCHVFQFDWHPLVNDTLSPSWDILTTYRDYRGEDKYAVTAGTSFGAPILAGAIAMIRQTHPNLTVEQIKHAILVSGRAPTIQPWTKSLGFLNVPAALDAAGDPATLPAPGAPYTRDEFHRCTGLLRPEAVPEAYWDLTRGLYEQNAPQEVKDAVGPLPEDLVEDYPL